MSYVDDNLLPGERVIYRAHLHWLIFFWPSLLVFAALTQVVIISPVGIGRLLIDTLLRAAWPSLFYTRDGQGIAFWLSISPMLALSLLLFTSTIINYITSEFAITEKRVMVKVGFIRRKTLEMQLGKVESAELRQGIVDRILNGGDVVVRGTGGSKQRFGNISAPSKLRKELQGQLALTV